MHYTSSILGEGLMLLHVAVKCKLDMCNWNNGVVIMGIVKLSFYPIS